MSLVTAIIVSHKDDPEMIGTMVSKDIISTPVKQNDGSVVMSHEVQCGVCWNDHRNPAVSLHPVEDLEWLEIPGITETEMAEARIEQAISYLEMQIENAGDLTKDESTEIFKSAIALLNEPDEEEGASEPEGDDENP